MGLLNTVVLVARDQYLQDLVWCSPIKVPVNENKYLILPQLDKAVDRILCDLIRRN